MRPVQYFSKEYLEQCKHMKPADILRFLDEFRRLYSPAARGGSRLISLKVRSTCWRRSRPRRVCTMCPIRPRSSG